MGIRKNAMALVMGRQRSRRRHIDLLTETDVNLQGLGTLNWQDNPWLQWNVKLQRDKAVDWMVTQEMRKASDLPWIVRSHKRCGRPLIFQLSAVWYDAPRRQWGWFHGYDTPRTNRFYSLDIAHQDGSKRSVDITYH